jgi:hypothetical protein
VSYTSLYAVNCAEKSCVAVGGDQALSGEIRLSYDHGVTWVVSHVNNIPPLFSVDCSNNTCVAVGGLSFHAPSNNILVSRNAGKTWDKFNLSLDTSITELIMQGVNHVDNHWIAYGRYELNDARVRAGIATSDDDGQTWEWIKPFDALPKVTENRIYGLSCNKNICMAAGYYHQRQDYAALAIRDLNQSNWTIIAPVSDFYNAKLTDVSCTDDICMAVGVRRKWPYEIEGVLLAADAKGSEWNSQSLFATIPNVRESHLSSIHCHGQTCVAAGYYNTFPDMHFLGILFITHDLGQNWSSYVARKNESKNTYLTDVKIANHSITAIGRVAADNESSYMPLIVASRDEGQTWEEHKPFESYGLQCSQLVDIA